MLGVPLGRKIVGQLQPAGFGVDRIGAVEEIDPPAQVPSVAVGMNVSLQAEVGLVELVLVRSVVEGDRPVGAIARAERIDRGPLVEPSIEIDAIAPVAYTALPMRTSVNLGARAAIEFVAANHIAAHHAIAVNYIIEFGRRRWFRLRRQRLGVRGVGSLGFALRWSCNLAGRRGKAGNALLVLGHQRLWPVVGRIGRQVLGRCRDFSVAHGRFVLERHLLERRPRHDVVGVVGGRHRSRRIGRENA